MPKALYTLLIFLFSFSIAKAQTPTVQDCEGAIPICQMLYIDSVSYSGTGNVPNEVNPTFSCLGGSGELNSVWYETIIPNNGTFGFTITPVVTADDYDWAVFDITNNTCADIYNNAALELSCNFSGVSGNTGPNGGAGAPFESTIPVTTGQHLVLVITNWSGSVNGYSIDFSPSTTNPISANCNPNCNDSTYAVSITQLDSLSCLGSCDATLLANVTGGSGPYTYTWTNGSQGVGLDTLTSVCEGWITVTVDDTTGCSLSASYYVGGSDPFTLNETITNISCPGVCDGAVTVAVSGGNTPYSYSWVDESNGAVIGGTATISDLCPGDYTVNVTDALGCHTQHTYTVLDAVPLALASYSTTDATCGQCDGSATFTITGGTPPYTYSGNPTPGAGTVTGLCAGLYVLTVTDANGCTADFAMGVASTNGPSPIYFSELPASWCLNGCDAIAEVTGAVGAQREWYAPDGTLVYNQWQWWGACPGDYIVVVTDQNGCVSILPVTVTRHPDMVMSTIVTSTNCGASCDGTITANVTGGNGGTQFELNGVWSGPSGFFDNLCAGTYVVTAWDSIGCSLSDTVNVLANSPISIDAFFSTDEVCGALCTGTATVSASGGTLPYTWFWDGIPGSPSISNLCAGSHLLTIQDNSGCTTDTTFIVNPDTTVTIQNVVITDAGCAGACDGAVNIVATGAIEYSLNGVTFQASPTFTNLCPGTYTAYAQDSAGCFGIYNFGINGGVAITPSVSNDVTLCPNDCAQLSASGLASYTWTPAAGLDDPTIATPLACPTADTDYCVYGTDSTGCPSDTACISITVISSSSFSITPDVTINYGDSVLLCAFPIAGPYTYQWSNGVTQPCQTVFPDSTTTYSVTVTDSCGGVYSDSVTVTVLGGIGFDDLINTGFEFEIYPNPVINEATIALSLAGNAHVQWQLLDVVGRKIDESNARALTAGDHQLQVSMDRVTADGVYFLRLIVNDKSTTAKLVVRR